MTPSFPMANIADVALADPESTRDRALCAIGSPDGANGVVRQFGGAVPFAFDGPTVLRLFPSCRPSAIIWAIATIVIDAIERVVIGGARSKVLIKGGEIVAPSIADADPASPIMAKVFRTGVLAPVDHRTPGVIFPRTTSRSGVMPGEMAVLSNVIAVETSTTLRITAAQITAIHATGLPALASAQPQRAVSADDGQARKLLSGQVYQPWYSPSIAYTKWVSNV